MTTTLPAASLAVPTSARPSVRRAASALALVTPATVRERRDTATEYDESSLRGTKAVVTACDEPGAPAHGHLVDGGRGVCL